MQIYLVMISQSVAQDRAGGGTAHEIGRTTEQEAILRGGRNCVLTGKCNACQLLPGELFSFICLYFKSVVPIKGRNTTQ